ncbi:MAG: iron uptake system protein EfeO [Micromonosporaceae bacterium]
MRVDRLVALAAVGVLAVSGCSSKESAKDGSRVHKIAVTATDDACELAETELKAGSHTFAVKNEGKQVTEFYVYAGEKVVSEAENIKPGDTRDLTVDLAAGAYEGACKPGMKGEGIRTAFTVTGDTKAESDPKLKKAVADYRAYVAGEADQLVTKTEEFVKLIKAGKVEEAKRLFPVARVHWERIEPVAEIFGDLDPAIDARENDVEPGQQFTGFHKLEKDLWVTKDISKSGPTADKLLVDVKKIVKLAKAEELKPFQLANGSKELLDEVATTKITGEEDRYSHTDLWDFHANVEGSKAAIDALRPALEERDPKLLKTVEAEFAKVAAVLGKHKKGAGWKLHTELSKAELKELSDAINALGEPVSKVAAAVAK